MTDLIKFPIGAIHYERVGKVVHPQTLIKSYPEILIVFGNLIRLNDKVFTFDDTVLKYATDWIEEPATDFYREIIVGLELNKLQSPNFAKTLGYYVDNRCQMLSSTNPDLKFKKCVYLYLEKVPGPTLAKFLITASLSQFKNIFIKLLMGYKLAHDTLNFTHYDLHRDNIIITTKNDELVPVMIDFGLSHISLPNGDLGDTLLEQGIYSDKANWIYDFFKLIAFCAVDSALELRFETAVSNLEEYRGEITKVLNNRRLYKRDDEDFSEFIDRSEGVVPKEIYDKLKYINDSGEDELQLINDLTQNNGFNLEQINSYCLKVLKYFHTDITNEWLTTYRDQHNKYFASFLTNAGQQAKFDDFIAYVKTL